MKSKTAITKSFRNLLKEKNIKTRGRKIEIIPRKFGVEWDGNLYSIVDIPALLDYDEFDIYVSPVRQSLTIPPEIVGTIKKIDII